MADADSNRRDDSASSDGIAFANRWKQYLAAAAVILTGVAQLWSAIENQWRLAFVTLLLAIVLAAVYFLSHRLPVKTRQAEVLRLTMIGLLIAIPLFSLVGLYAYSYLPRISERGTTTIAIARFAGPSLPEPYNECRPSDMLLHALARVGARFGSVKAFELPYSIDPDNRWASWWAQAHGWFEAADVIVYGEYTLHKSVKAGPTDKPDELVINPEVARIPTIPLFDRSAPLYTWYFRGSVANIKELCGSDLRDAGPAPPFLDDARRIALAVTGAQLLGQQEYEGAEEALTQAKLTRVDTQQSCETDASHSLCPGVLAFYLATLDARFGNYEAAQREYRYAAGALGTAAPFINLGELYMQLGKPDQAFRQFDKAVEAAPNSVTAVATRAQYERDYLRAHEAAIDLDRALHLKPNDVYDRLVLSRALYQRGGQGDAACGIRHLQVAMHSRGFDPALNVDTLVRFGVWLRGAGRTSDAIEQLERALRFEPSHVKGNYTLGLAFEQNKPPDAELAEIYLRRAEYAPARTDENFLDRANAASELERHFDRTPDERRIDYAVANDAYAASLRLNPSAVYAYYGRATLEENANPRLAENDLRKAATLHPYDAMIQSRLAQFLDSHGRKAQGKPYHDRAKMVTIARIPEAETHQWALSTCSYVHMDAERG